MSPGMSVAKRKISCRPATQRASALEFQVSPFPREVIHGSNQVAEAGSSNRKSSVPEVRAGEQAFRKTKNRRGDHRRAFGPRHDRGTAHLSGVARQQAYGGV